MCTSFVLLHLFTGTLCGITPCFINAVETLSLMHCIVWKLPVHWSIVKDYNPVHSWYRYIVLFWRERRHWKFWLNIIKWNVDTSLELLYYILQYFIYQYHNLLIPIFWLISTCTVLLEDLTSALIAPRVPMSTRFRKLSLQYIISG